MNFNNLLKHELDEIMIPTTDEDENSELIEQTLFFN